MKIKLAMDKSLRSKDQFGRMRVEMSNISKAIVNPYRGNEIPNCEGLGLSPDKVYMLLRDPAELAKAAHTFNNLPLLDRHIPVTADEPSKEFIVGSTGTEAVFDEPYLRNSLMIWCANSIAGIETDQQRELSSAYSYDADMTPGTYGGVAYDGIMRNIKGNHVALVEAGRAGSDVIVGDSKLLEKPEMRKGKLSAKAKTLLAACLMACVKPVLAQDAQIEDLTAIAGSVDSLKTAKDKQAIITAIKPLMAQDADLGGVMALLDALGDGEDPVALDEDDLDEDGNPKKKVAEDEDPPEKKDMIDKPAMDAAIATATAATVKRMNAIFTATKEVEAHIGPIAIAQDSAEAVYKLALDAAKVDLTDVPPSAYRALFKMLKAPGEQQSNIVNMTIAQDSFNNGVKGFDAMFPNASKMKGGA